MADKKKRYSQKVRSAWLAKRRWPFHVGVITPYHTWRISAGIYDTFGEGSTFEEAVDDAITNERLRKKGCCTTNVPLVTEITEPKARQMYRAIKAMEKMLTDGCYRRICQ